MVTTKPLTATPRLRDDWCRIAGVHITDVGDVGAVWLAHDKEVDSVHLYDCAFFRSQPWPVITEGFSARGRYIPIAWEKHAEAVMTNFEEHGLNMVSMKFAPLDETPAFREVTSAEIDARMRTRRFWLSPRATEWKAEYQTFFREESSVPSSDSHPLMAATRYAIAQLKWARPLRRKTRSGTVLAPKLAIV